MIKCPKCGGDKIHKNGKERKTGKQKYHCVPCKYDFTEGVIPRTFEPKQSPASKIGISLEEFRDKHDVEYILKKTMGKLDANLIYDKNDIVKLSGLPYNAQGLNTILESMTNFYGKTGGKTYYSHPDTIKMLKTDAKLT